MGLIIGVFVALAALIGDVVYTIAQSDKDKKEKAIGFGIVIFLVVVFLLVPTIIVFMTE